MKCLHFAALGLIVAGCSTPNSSTTQYETDTTAVFSEYELANDEPGPDDERITSVIEDVAGIDESTVMFEVDYVYDIDQGPINMTVKFDEDERGIRWLRKVAYETGDRNARMYVQFYYDLEGKLLMSTYNRSTADEDLKLNMLYDKGEMFRFTKEVITDGGSEISHEYDESILYEAFDGVYHFYDANELKTNPRLIERKFFVGYREDYFDVEGDLENADQPKFTRNENDYTLYGYQDIYVFVREIEADQVLQKVTFRSDKSDNEPVTEIPLPTETYFRGLWHNCLIFEQRANGHKLHVYDTNLKDFVLIRDYFNAKITTDREYLVFTAKIPAEEARYSPICTPETDGQEIGYMELIHLDRNYTELRYGQVFCYLIY